MKKKNFLAIDIGATSGRGVVGSLTGVKFEMHEIYRFPNAILEVHGKYYWDVYQLYDALKECLKCCARQGIALDSIGIDTWGVDFGYIAKDGTLLGLPRAYRDPYTEGAPEEYFKHIPREEVYRLTGIQIMNFNSLFQLYSAKKEGFAPLEAAEDILFMPDLLSYLLTGKKVCEYTIASTSQILNPVTKRIEPSLLEVIGLSEKEGHFFKKGGKNFEKAGRDFEKAGRVLEKAGRVLEKAGRDFEEAGQFFVHPGTVVGTLTDALAKETGVGKVPVIAVAGHDTASAIVAVPAVDPHFAYLSSGTWSLLGIETEEPIITPASYANNFTNEGGIEGTTRFLKNITGMWLLEQCRKEWEREGKTYTYPQIVAMAKEAALFPSVINPDDPSFANPPSMPEAIAAYCKNTDQPVPQTDAEYIYCIFHSLANRYKEMIGLLSEMAPFPIKKLHVIGGGSKNDLLNQFTANAIGMPVIAGPSEATAIGNCMIQAQAAGLVKDRWEMRRIIAESFPLETFLPETINN
ncbi:rhamnulokinase family protein [Parabacteroides sp. PF5-6]|uniref:rhamnulokinase n=1 Tax=Parabacteroides sp. PF5-6 TaxID=1742403 RepID=UPI002406CD5F|nr:rhamnulokinase family protein [Parabacteroides sp. PF5-6]